MSSKLNVVFAGTPDFAATILQALISSRHSVIACYSQPDRPAGRGRKLTPGPVKQLALAHDIPVHQPINFKQPEALETLQQLNADIMVVVAYGLLLPQAVLDAPRLGCINVHASLLPRWRGAAPIQRAIAAGDQETGITIMQMDAGLDTGDSLSMTATPIAARETGGQLHDRLAHIGAQALLETLDAIAADSAQRTPQDHSLANYAHKLSKEEAQLDWSQSANQLDCQIRAFNPWPVAQAQLDEHRLRIWQAEPVDQTTNQAPGTIITTHKDSLDVATGEGVLRITELQLSSGKRLPVAAILNSKADWFQPGKQFH